MVPALPAAADTAGVIAFVDGKAIVQCPPDAAGNTGLAAPGLGLNKGKKCGFSFGSSNVHTSTSACVGAGVSDPLKKGNKKAPQAGLCSISASGTLGPRLKSPIDNSQFGGPWCGASQGEDGSGSFTVGTKTVTFNRLRFQSQGTTIVVTASGFKPGVGKPGQAGPVVAVVHAFSDLQKIAGGVPNSSCLTNAKNFSVDGIAAGLLLGVK